MIKNANQALLALKKAWPQIQLETKEILGSELHYQAMIYHILRKYIPLKQLGMNVKILIKNPVTAYFKHLDKKKKPDYRGFFEDIPDITIFNNNINGDWRRRNNEKTFENMLLTIEVKCSERKNGKLRPKEIIHDIRKAESLREEAKCSGFRMISVVMILDTAPDKKERMTNNCVKEITAFAKKSDVELLIYHRKD